LGLLSVLLLSQEQEKFSAEEQAVEQAPEQCIHFHRYCLYDQQDILDILLDPKDLCISRLDRARMIFDSKIF
jgi:hypothetical protein